jgi:hypothetical protein
MENSKKNRKPFKNFDQKLTDLWASNNFSKEEAEKWIKCGLKINDYSFAKWLVEKKVTYSQFSENRRYWETKSKWIDEKLNGKLELKSTIRNRNSKIFSINPSSFSLLKLEEEKTRVELYKEMDKGKKLETKIIGIDSIGFNPLIFTISDSYREWCSDEMLDLFFTENSNPYKEWKIGDKIEIDIERLNGEKFSFEWIKSSELGIVKSLEEKEKIKKKIKEIEDENKKMREKIKELEEELGKDKNLQKRLISDYDNLSKLYEEEIRKNATNIR